MGEGEQLPEKKISHISQFCLKHLKKSKEYFQSILDKGGGGAAAEKKPYFSILSQISIEQNISKNI